MLREASTLLTPHLRRSKAGSSSTARSGAVVHSEESSSDRRASAAARMASGTPNTSRSGGAGAGRQSMHERRRPIGKPDAVRSSHAGAESSARGGMPSSFNFRPASRKGRRLSPKVSGAVNTGFADDVNVSGGTGLMPSPPSVPRLQFLSTAESSAIYSSSDSEEDDVTRTLNQNRISILHWT
jgi:hypothetical protein